MATFGKLEPVAIHDGWPCEDTGFTRWLAEEENLSALGDELCIPLELVETESGVGSYRLDILAKRVDSEESVVIENQFGATDHSHLGQLLTYASGVGSEWSRASTVVQLSQETAALSGTSQLYREFWNAFISFCKEEGTTLQFPSAPAQHWLPTPIGRASFGLALSRRRPHSQCYLQTGTRS